MVHPILHQQWAVLSSSRQRGQWRMCTPMCQTSQPPPCLFLWTSSETTSATWTMSAASRKSLRPVDYCLIFLFCFNVCKKYCIDPLGKFTWVRLQQLQMQRYPFLPVFLCVQIMLLLPVFAIVCGGCENIVRNSALKINSWRKIPWHIGKLNPHQYCTWLFGVMCSLCVADVVLLVLCSRCCVACVV